MTIDVFKLQFDVGEFDMVVCDNASRRCHLFEVKHSGEMAAPQFRHLADPKKLRHVQDRFGDVVERTVLYRGENVDLDGGIRYRNVNAYLKSIVDNPGRGLSEGGK